MDLVVRRAPPDRYAEVPAVCAGVAGRGVAQRDGDRPDPVAEDLAHAMNELGEHGLVGGTMAQRPLAVPDPAHTQVIPEALRLPVTRRTDDSAEAHDARGRLVSTSTTSAPSARAVILVEP